MPSPAVVARGEWMRYPREQKAHAAGGGALRESRLDLFTFEESWSGTAVVAWRSVVLLHKEERSAYAIVATHIHLGKHYTSSNTGAAISFCLKVSVMVKKPVLSLFLSRCASG